MRIDELLKQSKIKTIETEILLAAVLKKDRSFINSFPETILSNPQENLVSNFIARRAKNEPIPYILGFKEFYGLKFLVNQDVLIPRPETEIIIDKILLLQENLGVEPLVIADIGTGSGCIAITLAVKNPKLHIIATDISSQALAVAIKNAKLHQVENRIKFIESNLLEKVNAKIDIVAANLPYIPTENWEELPAEIKYFEPRLALDSGKSASILYHLLFEEAAKKLNPEGVIFYEIDGSINQVSAVDLTETLPE